MSESICGAGARIERHTAPGLVTSVLYQGVCRELFITARHASGTAPSRTFARVAEVLSDFKAHPVAITSFGFAHDRYAHTLRQALGSEAPVTWINPDPASGDTAAGIEVWAVAGVATEQITVGGEPLGVMFSNGTARICRLGGLEPPDRHGAREQQARAVLERMKSGVEAAGMTFANVARTWFFNDAILEWYGSFNHARDAFFHENDLFRGMIPASTGVAGRNPRRAALTGGLVAFHPVADGVSVMPLASPLQCPALDYGSAFSRAVEVTFPGHRRVLISGTASIEPGGRTIHPGDVAGQIRQTFAVVSAILESRGMGWGHVCRAIAYVKEVADLPTFQRCCADSPAADIPMIIAHNDICRDDLLFELEADAIGVM